MAEETGPSWMDAGNDDSHRAEIEPLLFGTGDLSLYDQANNNDKYPDVEKGSTKNVKYGSTVNGREGEDDSDDDDTEDNHHEDDKAAEKTAVASASTSSKQSSKSSKKQPQKKPEKKKTEKKKKVNNVVITESGKPESPRRNCLMASFNLIESLGVITCLALMASQIMPIVIIPLGKLGIANICLKIYISLFCVLFMVVEWDVPVVFLKHASFLQTYLSRGFLYSFIGLSALEEAYSERVSDMIAHAKDRFHVSWFSLFMQVSSWMMLSLGIIYMLFGVCCLKAVRDKLKKDHKEKWKNYREAMKAYRRENP